MPALTALRGMGGIGKSQLARRFAEQQQAQYVIGAWLEAESDASLYAALGTLGRQLGLPEDANQQTYAVRVLQAVRDKSPWLLIFDPALRKLGMRNANEAGNETSVPTSASISNPPKA